jgi:hypothetical protein
MGEPWRWRGRRLRGLEEFVTPAFVGRMARVERKRRYRWWAALVAAFSAGAALGLALI